jgi:hypothetical protein
MFMTVDLYLKRIYHTLEHVIAPEVDDDFARGQVFAVINLLEQLGQKVEYKQDLIAQEIEQGSKILSIMVAAVQDAGADIPEKITSFMKELESGSPAGLSKRNRLEEMLCLAIDLLHENKGLLEPERYAEVDRQVRDYITKLTTRDLGLMKPPAVDKISRPKKGTKK